VVAHALLVLAAVAAASSPLVGHQAQLIHHVRRTNDLPTSTKQATGCGGGGQWPRARVLCACVPSSRACAPLYYQAIAFAAVGGGATISAGGFFIRARRSVAAASPPLGRCQPAPRARHEYGTTGTAGACC
jgi:hypothetical protein